MLPATAGSLGQGCCRPRLQPGAGPTHVVSWSAVQLARHGGLQAAPLATPTAAQGMQRSTPKPRVTRVCL